MQTKITCDMHSVNGCCSKHLGLCSGWTRRPNALGSTRTANSVDLTPCENSMSSAGHEILRNYGTKKVHHLFHNSPPHDTILRQIDPLYTLPSHFLRFIWILTFHSYLSLPNAHFPSSFSTKILYSLTSLLSHACHMPPPFHSPVDSSDHAAPHSPVTCSFSAPNTSTTAVLTFLRQLVHILNQQRSASRFAKETWIFLLCLQWAANETTEPSTVQKQPSVVALPPCDNNTGKPNYVHQKKKSTFCLSRKKWTRERIEQSWRGRIAELSALKRGAFVTQEKGACCVRWAHSGHCALCPVATFWTLCVVSGRHILDTVRCVRWAHYGHGVLCAQHVLDRVCDASCSTRPGFVSRRGHQLQPTCYWLPQLCPVPQLCNKSDHRKFRQKPNSPFTNSATIRYSKFQVTAAVLISVSSIGCKQLQCWTMFVITVTSCLTSKVPNKVRVITGKNYELTRNLTTWQYNAHSGLLRCEPL